MGGRVAEDIIFGRVSTGAQNDLERITNMTFAMVAVYGMSEEIGNISFYDSGNPEGSFGFNRKYSESTAEKIDLAVNRFIEESYARTKELLLEHKELLITMAKTLLEKEILTGADLIGLLGERPHGNYPISSHDVAKIKEIQANGNVAVPVDAPEMEVTTDNTVEDPKSAATDPENGSN